MQQYWNLLQSSDSRTSIVLPQEQAGKNKAASLQSKGPPRQEQEGSAGDSARASLVGNRLPVFSIKGRPHQIARSSGQEYDKNKKHPLPKAHSLFLQVMTVDYQVP